MVRNKKYKEPADTKKKPASQTPGKPRKPPQDPTKTQERKKAPGAGEADRC